MNPLLWWLLQNFILVLILVVFVSIACLALKNRPALRHALWLVVLLKFVTPPIIVWPWSLEQVASSVVNVKTEDPNSERSASYVVLNTKSAQQNAGSNAHVESSDDVSASAIVSQTRSSPSSLTGNIANSRVPSLVLVTTWIAGCLVVLTIQIQRILRQRIVISTATTAPDILVREFEHVSRQLKVKPLNICVSNKTSSPFLYCLWPLRLVWPISLSEKRELSRSRGIIAHELAHVRRRDHWAVWLEFIAGAIWWWNPLFWFVRTRLRESAEMACDAIALSVYDDRRAYAEIFLELSSTPKLGMPTTALGVSSGSLSSFERRLSMILSNQVSGKHSVFGVVLIACIAAITLPSWSIAQTAKTASEASERSDESSTANPSSEFKKEGAAPNDSEFPHAVKFEQGDTEFNEGDNITILEIHGTAKTFTPGNQYHVKGTYTLKSQEAAVLAVYTTASDSANAIGNSSRVQTMEIKRGNGEFSVTLPMTCEGWPHVSFYGKDDGAGFGGTYFGTGNSVLKKKRAVKGTSFLPDGGSVLPGGRGQSEENIQQQEAPQRRLSAGTGADSATRSEFPHAVRFEQGAVSFLDGDNITITQIRGTSETFSPGNIYLIKGTFRLGTHDKAMLGAYTTAKNAADGTGPSWKGQKTNLERGKGTFTLFLPMSCEGWPHVSFYGEGNSFGENYFGTGDSVLNKSWGEQSNLRR